MKSWLPALVGELREGGAPALALCSLENVSTAALFSRDGRFLAGGLGRQKVHDLAAASIPQLAGGEVKIIREGAAALTLEILAPETLPFWQDVLDASHGAWAAWLLTMPTEDGRLARHFISAFGPNSWPRLPEDQRDDWSLTPLTPGLGRLFVFGDDALALEVAGLAARTGLVVTCVATEPPQLELAEARTLGDFELCEMPSWERLTARELSTLGLRPGVRIIVTTPALSRLEADFKAVKPAHLTFLTDQDRPAAVALVAAAIEGQPL